MYALSRNLESHPYTFKEENCFYNHSFKPFYFGDLKVKKKQLGHQYTIMFLRYEYTVYIEDIQFFIMNMPFISSSEAKNAYFMSGFTYTFTR